MSLLNTIRNTAARIVMRGEMKQVNQLKRDLTYAIETYPTRLGPAQMKEMVSELDPQMVQFLLRQIENQSFFVDQESEIIRENIIRESRQAYMWDPVTQNGIDLWTNYGFGTDIEVIPKDEKALDIWNEFWEAPRNRVVLGTRRIQRLSEEVLAAGEIYFVMFISELTGDTMIRWIRTEEIKEIVKHPEDSSVPLFYVREYVGKDLAPQTIYYPDWRASEKELDEIELPKGAIRADQQVDVKLSNDEKAGTDVKMIRVAHRVKGKTGRGWPLMTAGLAWARAYKNFLQDRAAVAKAVATYVDKIQVDGGSRAIDNIAAQLSSGLENNPARGYDDNPVATAGSDWLENKKVSRTRMPLTTGGADAEKDGVPMLNMAALSANVFVHYMGSGQAFRLATATAMEQPTLRAFNRYQSFWASVWRDVVAVVLTAQELYNGKKYETKDAQVNLDPLVQVDQEEITAIGKFLIDASDKGLVTPEEAGATAEQLIRISLNKLGIKSGDIFDTEEVGKPESPLALKELEKVLHDTDEVYAQLFEVSGQDS